ncbi:MAG: hypothetical protein NTX45_19670 [Proteobacteria bacterium]|nr:hypothetical protein [Pseudomonadota bacterium]
MQMHNVEVSAETNGLIREHFNRILLIEDEQFDRRDALENDRRLLEALQRLASHGADPSSGFNRLELRGAGLFLPDGWQYTDSIKENAMHPVDASLARLAGRVDAAYGSDFLRAKTRDLTFLLQSLKPSGYDQPIGKLAEDRFQSADYSFSGRYADHLSALAALRVLELRLPLREGSLVRPKGAEFRLGESEKLGLARYRDRLEDQLLAPLRQNRPDWGFPLLLGMARLIALDESIASGHLRVLNLAEPRDAKLMTPANRAAVGHADHVLSRAKFNAAKTALAGTEILDEWAYLHLEQATNIFVELGNALHDGRVANLNGMNSMPARPASLELTQLAMTSDQLQSHLDSLEGHRSAYGDSLAKLYAYNLIGRNCASEIFRVMGQAMREAPTRGAPPEAQAGLGGIAEAESVRRLGGYVSGQGLEFIPFQSFRRVGRAWRVASTELELSFRLRSLEQAKNLENPFWVSLRESNVFSSSLYQWHGRDPAFVFFTDDLLWARPLAGGFNFVAGLAQGMAGLLTLPWDGGENLRLGVKGALISLPELFFFNIRKGSFPGLIDLNGL